MNRIERQIVIEAPADRVFAYVSDFTRHPEWAAVPMQIAPVEAGPTRLGSRYVHTARMMGKQRDSVTVTAFQPSSRLEFDSQGKAGLLKHWFLLEQEGNATVLTKGLQPIRPSLLTRIMGPMVSRKSAGFIEQDLEKIRGRLRGES